MTEDVLEPLERYEHEKANRQRQSVRTKCGKNVLSYLRVGIYVEHQNTCTKRMKGADISASVARNLMDVEEDRMRPMLSLNYTHACMPSVAISR